MARIVAVYEGQTIGDARLIAASADQELVRLVTAKMSARLSDDEPKVPRNLLRPVAHRGTA